VLSLRRPPANLLPQQVPQLQKVKTNHDLTANDSDWSHHAPETLEIRKSCWVSDDILLNELEAIP
jgi:hypothetical protein